MKADVVATSRQRSVLKTLKPLAKLLLLRRVAAVAVAVAVHAAVVVVAAVRSLSGLNRCKISGVSS